MATGNSATPAVTDRSMWKKLRAVCHPDRAGDEDLFVWVDTLREFVNGEGRFRQRSVPRREPPPPPHPIDVLLNGYRPVYVVALSPLRGFVDLYGSMGLGEDATPKQVAYIAHLRGMDYGERQGFYEVCKEIGLDRESASWLIEEFKDG